LKQWHFLYLKTMSNVNIHEILQFRQIWFLLSQVNKRKYGYFKTTIFLTKEKTIVSFKMKTWISWFLSLVLYIYNFLVFYYHILYRNVLNGIHDSMLRCLNVFLCLFIQLIQNSYILFSQRNFTLTNIIWRYQITLMVLKINE
jgi:hypothetical protein